jgi:site-specific recombinase XerD
MGDEQPETSQEPVRADVVATLIENHRAFLNRSVPSMPRHSFGPSLRRATYRCPQIQTMMGHESIDTTMRYVIVIEQQLDDAMDVNTH